MNLIKVTFLCLLINTFSYSQDSTLLTRLWLKGGVTLLQTQYVVFGNYDDGTHYHYAPSSGYKIESINDRQWNNYSPICSFGMDYAPENWLRYYLGVTYTQYKQSFQYKSYNVVNLTQDSSYNFHYDEFDDKAYGSITNNVFRFEFTPAIVIRKTRILLPVPNIDLVYPSFQTHLAAERQYYKIVQSPNYSSGPSVYSNTPNGSAQNVSLTIPKNYFTYPDPNDEMSKFGVSPPKRTPFVYFPVSLRIEQELIIKGMRWLVGIGAVYSKRAAYYGYNFYIGYCFKSF